jgi:hypothetical protein
MLNITTTNGKAVLETLKSIGRGLWFGILGLIVVALAAVATSGDVSNAGVTIAGFTLNLSVIILAVVGYLAKIIDTYIHNNQNIASHGIAPPFLQQ